VYLKHKFGALPSYTVKKFQNVLALRINYTSEVSFQKLATSLRHNVIKKKVKVSLLEAVEAPRVARGRGSHIT
jgi:hypothetical protein